MANGRFGNDKAPRRGFRGYIWLVAALLALALAGLGFEHGGGSPTSPLNGVLSAANKPAPAKTAPKNSNAPENEAQSNASGGDDANHADNDCDSVKDGFFGPNDPRNTCTPKAKGGKNPPPPKCNFKDDEHAENPPESKSDEKAEHKQEQQEHKTCEMSAHKKP